MGININTTYMKPEGISQAPLQETCAWLPLSSMMTQEMKVSQNYGTKDLVRRPAKGLELTVYVLKESIVVAAKAQLMIVAKNVGQAFACPDLPTVLISERGSVALVAQLFHEAAPGHSPPRNGPKRWLSTSLGART